MLAQYSRRMQLQSPKLRALDARARALVLRKLRVFSIGVPTSRNKFSDDWIFFRKMQQINAGNYEQNIFLFKLNFPAKFKTAQKT